MSKESRNAKIAELENRLESKVLCFLTTDRIGVEQQSGMITRDCVKIVERHLDIAQEYPVLSLFLVSHGGDVNVPWALVKLLRSHCKKLQLVMPYVCHSAATMIALGCDELIAGPRGQLSPTDPTLSVKSGNGANSPIMQFGVEDINAFLDFTKSSLGRQYSRYGHEALAKLIDRVQPEILGSINRTYFRNKKLIEKLLNLSPKKPTKNDLNSITDKLTVAYYSHGHFISRDEMVDDLHLNVIKAETLGISDLIWDLYEEYAEEFKSRKIYDVQAELQRSTSNPTKIDIKAKYVESRSRTDVYTQTTILQGSGTPNFNFTLPQLQQPVQRKRPVLTVWTRIK